MKTLSSDKSKMFSLTPALIFRPMRRRPGFYAFVVFPTLLTALYYTTIASPQYVSEAEFIVQGQKNQSNLMLAGLLEAGNGTNTSEDTYAVQDYLTSRDSAELLIKNEKINNIYNYIGADFLSKFPNFYTKKTFEHFYSYYKRHIIADLDTTSGVSTLQVRTFRAEDSQRIAKALVKAAENLVNKMNDRQRYNTIAASEKELDIAKNKLRLINENISSYRNQISMLNPDTQAQSALKDIARLETFVISNKVTLAQLERSANDSPLIQVYRQHISSLEQEIYNSEKKITGSDLSFVPKISGYESLLFQRGLMEKEVSIASSAVANAKIQADRQLLYLNEITQPNLPDYASYPKSFANTAVVFATFLGIYLMSLLLISGAKEHKLV